MAKYSIDYTKAMDAAEQIRKSSKCLSSMGKKTSEARLNNSSTIMSSNSVNVLRIEEQILNEAAQMDTLAEALEKIITYYQTTEAGLLPDGYESSALISKGFIDTKLEAFWKWFRGVLESLGIIKAGTAGKAPATQDPAPNTPAAPESPAKTPATEKPADPPVTATPPTVGGDGPVTRSQEAAQDLYMQNEISKLLSQSRYSEQTWKKSSTEERKAILSEYMTSVAAIMGVSVNNINYFYSESQNGYYTLGQYSHGTRTVSINEWVIEKRSDSYSLMKTIVHELRHAYQHSAVDNPDQFIVSAETIQTWQDNFRNYKSQTGFMNEGMSASQAFAAYRNQAVEVDARSFAKQS